MFTDFGKGSTHRFSYSRVFQFCHLYCSGFIFVVFGGCGGGGGGGNRGVCVYVCVCVCVRACVWHVREQRSERKKKEDKIQIVHKYMHTHASMKTTTAIYNVVERKKKKKMWMETGRRGRR